MTFFNTVSCRDSITQLRCRSSEWSRKLVYLDGSGSFTL